MLIYLRNPNHIYPLLIEAAFLPVKNNLGTFISNENHIGALPFLAMAETRFDLFLGQYSIKKTAATCSNYLSSNCPIFLASS
jgi:hypothetical protein